MKTRNFAYGTFVFFVLVLLSGSATAAQLTLTIVEDSLPANINHNAGSFTFDLSILNNGTASDVALEFVETGGIFDVSFSEDPVHLETGDSAIVAATVTFNAGQSGSISGDVIADPSGPGDSRTVNFSVPINQAVGLSMNATQQLTLSQDGIIRVTNTGNVVINNIALTSSGDFAVALNPATPFSLNGGESRTVTVSSNALTNLDFGENIVSISASGRDPSNNMINAGSVQFSVPGSFCKTGPRGGNLSIKNVEIDNQGEGDDDEWKLLDTVEVEVEVENEGDEDIDDVFVELGLFDSNGDNMVNDFDFENNDEEEIDVGDFKDSDEETVTFRFRVPADVEDGSYKLAVKAFSDDLGEGNECSDSSTDLSDNTFERIQIQREDEEGRFIAFEDIIANPDQVTCGEQVTLSMTVFNIGDEDQDRVKINLKSVELDLEEFREITSDLDQGDKESLTFDFTVPQGLENRGYQLRLSAEYDYTRGTYRESSDEDKIMLLNVAGCRADTGPVDGGNGGAAAIALITAEPLDSDVISGEELTVRSTVTNLKSESATFIVDVQGYQSWATLSDVSQRILDLDAGESREVVITFQVADDTEGQQTFTVEASSSGETESQEIAVNIGSAATTTRGGFDLGFGGENAYLWIIGIVNVILVILIIVVAVRISRK